MYAPLKKKEKKKINESSKPVSIEEGIPDVPQLSDFDVTEFLASSIPKNEIDEPKEYDLASEIDELNLEEEKNEEKEEEEDEILLSNLQSINEIESVISVEIKNNLEDDGLSIANQAQIEDKNELDKNDIPDTAEPKDKELECAVVSEKEENKETPTNYYNLATTVKHLIKEVQRPSAPTVEGSIMSCSSVKDPQKIQDKQLNKEKPVDFSKYNFSLIVEDYLPPFTDEKLSEFYYNVELHDSKNCVKEFIFQEINNQKMANNNLYKLLVAYVQSRNYLKSNEFKVKELKENIKVCTSTMWTVWNDVKVTEKEQCSDKNTVSFVETYTQAQFNKTIFEEFSSLLTQVKNVVYQTHIMGSFTCAILKLKIEYYLQNLLTSCPEFTNMEEDSPAILYSSNYNSHFQSCLSDLKMAVSILFVFQRKQTFDVDNIFLQETREWLSDLIAVLLRVGSWKDHIFILSHVMRCPGGVSEWAASFIQLPFSGISSDPFNNTELNHMMTTMNILLGPIEQREEFLKKWESELGDVNPWIVIDSDGEPEDDDQQSCPMKENDLVSFLNQIPFTKLFKAVLKYDEGKTTICYTLDYLLQLFSFFTNLIKIFHSGLQLYSSERYRQFAKRLGRLIYHLVQYATDALIIFKSQNVSEHEMLRVQVEYDNFFFKSTKFIYSAKKHGTWQFLATIPYNLPSYNAILKLYGILQLNDDNKEGIVKVNFSTFEEKFLELPEEEQFYLLTTFANMALARNLFEMQFIKNILLQLLYIGFLSPATMDHCYKNVGSLLCSICSSHPILMSEILYIQKNMFLSNPDHDQKLSTYLWIKLPVEVWQPSRIDIETLSTWLSEPIHAVQNELARIILQSLNYGIIQGKPFIPPESHLLIAEMVLESNVKLVLENETGVIKNVSNLVGFQNPHQLMNDWTWNILLKLRLHLLDQSEAEMYKCLYSIGDYLHSIPDVESKIELHHLVLKKHPVAIFVALMSTTLGHSVPIIFDKGFELVDVLLNAGKYESGIACLEYMTLMFLDCCDSLYKCEKFIFLLSRLIAADNTYVQFAKNLISSNFPGPVLKCVESMFQNQMNCCRSFNKLSDIVKLWLLSLTRIPLWIQEPGVLYLIDKLLENSFFDNHSARIVTAILEDLSHDNSPSSETKSSFSSLVSWMNSKYTPPSLLIKGYNGEVPWFSYKIIQMEYDIYEKKTLIWNELLKEMFASSDKKANVDSSLKKVCCNLKIPVRPSSVLAIYKWAYQLLETDVSHPLVSLIWQKFFTLYLYRVPGSVDRGSVGMKFFEGVINQSLFKRLKQRLQETCDHFKILSEQNEDRVENDYFLRYHKLFQTYSLWLDDPRLLEPCLSIHMLPIQYNPEILALLINGNETPWIEYLDYQKIEQNFKNGSSAWSKLKNRNLNERGNKIVSHKKEKSPANKIMERLNSYEISVPPPRVNTNRNVFPRVNIDILLNSDKMNFHVKPYVKLIFDFVQQYTSRVAENVSLGCDMQELLPRLYFTKEIQKTLKKHCNGINKSVNGKSVHYSCSGPAVVKLTYEESKVNEQAKQLFLQCEKAFDDNLHKALSSLPPSLISSAVLIDIIIEELRKEYHLAYSRGGDGKVVSTLKETGVHLFYDFVKTWCESVNHTPLLDKVFENYVEALGKTFIEGNSEENDRILHLILNDDMFGEKICKYFTPNASSTYDFIENYSKVLQCTSEKGNLILSQFDLSHWLSKKKPKFSDRSRIISIVCRGLQALGGTTEGNMIKLLNQHMEVLLMYDFPEHYGEILNFLIEGSEKQTMPTSSWFTFINSLDLGHCVFTEGQNDQVFEPGQSVKKLKYCFSKFATSQNLIPFDVITGTISLLASTFKEERLKVGIYGLYKKYRLYVEPIFIFFGMLSYSSVAKALEIDTGSLSEKITQQLCPLLNDLYSPWLVPYWVENGKILSPQWTQDQNTVFYPWSTNDSCYASFCASIFSESIKFLFDALPGENRVLSYTWFFYVTNFGNIHVKDYIFNVIHDSLLSLPWDTFGPSLQDVELMVKVVDQFLPLSHSFLGNIFVNIKWTELVQYYLSRYDIETTTKLHICLLHLLVKLPLEPSLKQNGKVITLLTEAKDYAWHLIDSCSYDMVLNWFIMSCDPRIILMDERLEYYKLDSTIFKLLQASAGYVSTAKQFHSTTPTKRLMFVKACIKWLITSNRRFKSKDSPLFKSALFTMWTEMETIISETVPPLQRVDEAGILLSEFFVIFAEPDLSTLVENTFCNWLSTRSSQTVTFGLFRTAGNSLENPNTYGSIIESSLENYFNLSEYCDWSEITNTLVSFSKSKSDAHLEKTLAENNCFLTLYAILLKKLYRNEIGSNSNSIVTDLLHLFSEVKLNADIEPKLILLIVFGLQLTENEIKYNLKQGISYLVKFSDVLNNFLNDKGNGFFSAIGLKKSASSNRFKLICLIVCSGIIFFLKKNYPDHEESTNDKILQALESADSNKVYQSINQYASYAKTAVKEMKTVEQIITFLKHIGLKLFNKLYLK